MKKATNGAQTSYANLEVYNMTKETIFECVIGAERYKHFIEVISEANPETSMTIGPEGINVRRMDPSHVVLVDAILPAHIFSEYKLRQEVSLGLDLENVQKFLKRASKDSILVFKVDKETTDKGDKFVPSWKTCAKNTREYIGVDEDMYGDKIKTPKIFTDVKVVLDVKELVKSIEDVELVSDHVTFEANDKFWLKGGTDSKVNVHYETGDPTLFEFVASRTAEATYNITYLKSLLKVVKDRVCLEFATNIPLVMKFDVADGGEAIYILGPRVEREKQ